ncbi:unnamed protein product [Blepharisma stoltei]|uniref:Uncharacterized protein n=1 Tax=Blepharisma stoltei TaxID=1481888 RepID=A0AAU9II12_9CILI|nr:unnamed protein product [Blepharisma stoltei]
MRNPNYLTLISMKIPKKILLCGIKNKQNVLPHKLLENWLIRNKFANVYMCLSIYQLLDFPQLQRFLITPLSLSLDLLKTELHNLTSTLKKQ